MTKSERVSTSIAFLAMLISCASFLTAFWANRISTGTADASLVLHLSELKLSASEDADHAGHYLPLSKLTNDWYATYGGIISEDPTGKNNNEYRRQFGVATSWLMTYEAALALDYRPDFWRNEIISNGSMRLSDESDRKGILRWFYDLSPDSYPKITELISEIKKEDVLIVGHER